MQKIIILTLLYFIGLSNLSAYSYIGPGLGVGIITIIFGFLLTVLVALIAIIYFPIKKMIFKIKKNKKKK